MNLDLTSDGSLKLLTRWGSIRVSLRPYGPAQSSEFCTIVICADSPGFQLHRLGNPYMSEGLQSISFRVIPRCSMSCCNSCSVATGVLSPRPPLATCRLPALCPRHAPGRAGRAAPPEATAGPLPGRYPPVTSVCPRTRATASCGAAAPAIVTIRHWLEKFLHRFFATSQFKRSALPNGPKVSSGGALSPRGDWRAPSDSAATPWLEELRSNVPESWPQS